MTKKQAGIICTLLALIVCTALLAAKLNNGGLNDPTDLSAIITTDNTDSDLDSITDSETNADIDEEKPSEDTETIGTTDFFYNAKSEREKSDAKLTENLQSIVNNENTSKEQKDEANKKLQKIALIQDKQRNIEQNIKNKGYEDALCQISESENKANIIIKSKELTKEEGAAIQEIVQNVSNIKEVTIEYKN